MKKLIANGRLFYSLFNAACYIIGVSMFAVAYFLHSLLEGLKTPTLLIVSIIGMVLSVGFIFMLFPVIPGDRLATFMSFPGLSNSRLTLYGVLIVGVVVTFLFSIGFAWFFLGWVVTTAIILSLVIGLALDSHLIPKDNNSK